MRRNIGRAGLVGAVLAAGVCLVRAQAAPPRGFALAGDTAVAFAADLSRQDDAALARLVSQTNTAQLHDSGVQRVIEYFQDEGLAARWSASPSAVNSMESANGKESATVKASATVPVAVVREKTDGQMLWRVDIVATLANCLELDREGTARKIFSLTGVVLPGARLPGAAKTAQCLENLQRLGLAMQTYVQDNDGYFPSARSWSEAVRPYGAAEETLRCPLVGPGAYGYAMNWKLSNKPSTLLDPRRRMVGLFETFDPERDARGGGADLAQRHDRGSNFWYALSSEVRWHPREEPQDFDFGG